MRVPTLFLLLPDSSPPLSRCCCMCVRVPTLLPSLFDIPLLSYLFPFFLKHVLLAPASELIQRQMIGPINQRLSFVKSVIERGETASFAQVCRCVRARVHVCVFVCV